MLQRRPTERREHQTRFEAPAAISPAMPRATRGSSPRRWSTTPRRRSRCAGMPDAPASACARDWHDAASFAKAPRARSTARAAAPPQRQGRRRRGPRCSAPPGWMRSHRPPADRDAPPWRHRRRHAAARGARRADAAGVADGRRRRCPADADVAGAPPGYVWRARRRSARPWARSSSTPRRSRPTPRAPTPTTRSRTARRTARRTTSSTSTRPGWGRAIRRELAPCRRGRRRAAARARIRQHGGDARAARRVGLGRARAYHATATEPGRLALRRAAGGVDPAHR